MIAYVDSSVILRVTLDQPPRLPEWDQILTGLTSTITEVECVRTIDRLRVVHRLGPDDAVAALEFVGRMLGGLEMITLDSRVLRRAGQPRAVALGTMDAIQLATAEIWRDEQGKEPLFATHDRQLALAARASGFRIAGV